MVVGFFIFKKALGAQAVQVLDDLLAVDDGTVQTTAARFIAFNCCGSSPNVAENRNLDNRVLYQGMRRARRIQVVGLLMHAVASKGRKSGVFLTPSPPGSDACRLARSAPSPGTTGPATVGLVHYEVTGGAT